MPNMVAVVVTLLSNTPVAIRRGTLFQRRLNLPAVSGIAVTCMHAVYLFEIEQLSRPSAIQG
jgi:hypothetical protein